MLILTEIPFTNKSLHSLRSLSITIGEDLSLERYMSSEDFLNLEKLFETFIMKDNQVFSSYKETLDFYNELLSIEGLLEKFVNFTIDEQIDLYENCYSEPTVLNELLLALESVNSDRLVFFHQSSTYNVDEFLSIIKYSEDVPLHVIDKLVDFTMLNIKDYSTDAAFTTLILIYIKIERKEDMLDLMNLCRANNQLVNLAVFMKLLNNWQEFKNYPLDWSLELIAK